jgi:hypothetical protein
VSALLNPREEAFCLAYVQKGASRGNATAAYLEAGFTTKSRSMASRAACAMKKEPPIARRIKELIERDTRKGMQVLISEREERLRRLQDRCDRMDAIIEARARKMGAEIEGGESGLFVRDYKGQNANRAVYKLDDTLLRELRAHEQQAAQELGQWTERREVTGALTVMSLDAILSGDDEQPGSSSAQS